MQLVFVISDVGCKGPKFLVFTCLSCPRFTVRHEKWTLVLTRRGFEPFIRDSVVSDLLETLFPCTLDSSPKIVISSILAAITFYRLWLSAQYNLVVSSIDSGCQLNRIWLSAQYNLAVSFIESVISLRSASMFV